MSGVKGEAMDRGSEAMKSHLAGASVMEMRQTKRGWCQELIGCDAKTEFKYFIGDQQVAHSLEDTDCCCRVFCTAIHPFKMDVKELNTEASLLELDRPCRCAASGCKCCCYQEATITSGGQELGSMKETCWYCVPEFQVFDHTGKGIYRLHQPTCCGGCCVNCCAEGNPCCGKGCCKVPYHLFPFDQANTNDAEHIGKILKKPKSMMTEIFTEAEVFECTFPNDATPQQKALIVGSALMINAMFFEGEDDNDGGS
ncbi:Phospholipid scramblase 1 [Seminavis robusta]|uniref:Phospholipid scramblase n=1 Tax=Seminavis robusta TaxID=568900 RepID=A0A9N8DPN4_9STRA|nr:Phospholipid scramblase 1 [Seminavis robusta]|eukprot:Sro249_g098720.1 Phospholipid scramblase 1 (255) ;mRNA; f:49131-50203